MRSRITALATRATMALAAIAFAGAIASLAAPAQAQAQDYPTKPITLVVPYAAGGGNDVLARVVAEPMARHLGQQIVVDNRGGAGGSIGTRQVAKAAPDGYTLVIGGTGSLAVNPTLYENVGYDPRKDFDPVGMIAAGQLVILVHPSVEAKTIEELIALARKEPGKVNYASAGVGSGIHLGAELFAHMAGIKLTHVPYKGTGPALNDLLGGHVMMYFSSIPPAARMVKDGRVRALAVTGTKRSALFPDVPTVAEKAVPGYEAVLRYGIVAPAGTPKMAIRRLNEALRASLATEAVTKRLESMGVDPLPGSPEDYAADIDHEEKKWSEIVKLSGAKAN